MSPKRRRRQPDATMRFETAPGEQAQVDWGSLAYIGQDGRKHRIWVFVMTLGWSRCCYVELVRRADTAAFIQCHVNAFEYLGGGAAALPLRQRQGDHPGPGRGEAAGVERTDAGLRPQGGLRASSVPSYRAQTKGKVESGAKYVRRNMWPSIRFTDDADLNRQGLEWCDAVANRRIHGTTHRVPGEMLAEERPHLGKMPVFSVNYFCGSANYSCRFTSCSWFRF